MARFEDPGNPAQTARFLLKWRALLCSVPPVQGIAISQLSIPCSDRHRGIPAPYTAILEWFPRSVALALDAVDGELLCPEHLIVRGLLDRYTNYAGRWKVSGRSSSLSI